METGNKINRKEERTHGGNVQRREEKEDVDTMKEVR